MNINNPRARRCGQTLKRRLKNLVAKRTPKDDPQRALLERIVQFPFDRYPDDAVPWHLLTWDPKRVRWAHVYHVAHIIEQLRQPTGSKMGEPLRLAPFQLMILLAFLGPEDPKTGRRQVREGLLTLARKNAKHLRVDEPIPTPQGWRTMGDLAVGDQVFGLDGRPCNVVGVSEVIVPERAYRLTFADGSTIEAGAEHQWLTTHQYRPWAKVPQVWRGRTHYPSVTTVVTTEQIAQSLHIPGHVTVAGKPVPNHHLALPAPVEYPERPDAPDPYARGQWLADNRNARFGKEYLIGSAYQRRRLLQGVIDHRGRAVKDGPAKLPAVEVTFTDALQAQDYMELAASLGYLPFRATKEHLASLTSTTQVHTVGFTAFREDGLFSDDARNLRLRTRPARPVRSTRRSIVACDLVDSTPMRCISVDGPRNVYLAGRQYIPTHNTTIVAGLTTALMVIHPDDHGLRGQDIQVGASDREQAGITWQMVDRFIHLDDVFGLPDKFRSVPSKKSVTHKNTLTTLKCLSSDAHRHHGGNPGIVLLDEIGNVSSAAAEEFYSVLTTAFGAQEEPLTLLFSTQAANDQHFFSQMVDRAKRINTGDLDHYDREFAGFVFTVPEEDEAENPVDPFDENLWYLANPGIDTIVSREDLRNWARKAQDMPSLENKFRLLKLNQRVSETAALVSRRAWERNTGAVPPIEIFVTPDRPDEPKRACYLGIDLSETTDLTALVAVFEPGADGRMPVYPYYWIPGEDLQGRKKRDHVPYDVWAKAGLIDVSSAHTVDYALLAAKIDWMIKHLNVRAIGFDRYKMKYLRAALKDLGYEWRKEDAFLIEIGQGFISQTRTVDLIEEAILESRLSHGRHPILTWNAKNTVTVQDPAGNRKFDKAKSYGRIDGFVALGIALHARDELQITGVGPSVYSDESVAVFM